MTRWDVIKGGLRNGWKEFLSRARWFGTYWLPKITAAPFQFTSFKFLYFLILSILILALLASLPFFWNDLITVTLMDILARIGAEKSGEMWLQVIRSLYAGWLLAIWLAYGALARSWAEPRRKFLYEMENSARLTLLRAGGERLAFLKRMNRALNTGLGLGPSGRLLADYYPRPEDAGLREKVKEIRRKRHPKGVLVSAPPVAGKTRTCLELIADLDPALVVVWREGERSEAFPSLPEWKGFVVILANDVVLSGAPDSVALPPSLDYLSQRCPQSVIVASARQERTPADVRELAVFDLKTIPLEALRPLAESIARNESRHDRQVTADEVLSRYNGHPGSLSAGLDAMRELYRTLDPEARAFLQTIKGMWEMGVRELSLERVWACYSDLWGQTPEALGRDEIVRRLVDKGFCNLSEKSTDRLSVYEAYIDQVIPPLHNPQEVEKKLIAGFQQREDGDAFQQIGDFCSYVYNPAYQENPQRELKKAIAAYERALAHYTPEDAPLAYAATQNNLGLAYSDLAAHQAPVENLGKAIQAYERALVYRTPERAPLAYAATQNNLGSAYSDLAAHQAPVENLERAIEAYEQALVYRTPEDAPLDYARSQHGLGVPYLRLAEHQAPVENLEKAIEAYERALAHLTPERAPLDYAGTLNNLRIAYSELKVVKTVGQGNLL